MKNKKASPAELALFEGNPPHSPIEGPVMRDTFPDQTAIIDILYVWIYSQIQWGAFKTRSIFP